MDRVRGRWGHSEANPRKPNAIRSAHPRGIDQQLGDVRDQSDHGVEMGSMVKTNGMDGAGVGGGVEPYWSQTLKRDALHPIYPRGIGYFTFNFVIHL
jgi:hypothetical protein